MGARSFYVYILANRIGGTLYIGVTNDLVRRVYEYKSGAAESFTRHHDVNRLVYFECFEDVEAAIHREKRLKKWTRAWKIALIEKDIPIGLIFILRSPADEQVGASSNIKSRHHPA
jgi:putative endonuclease